MTVIMLNIAFKRKRKKILNLGRLYKDNKSSLKISRKKLKSNFKTLEYPYHLNHKLSKEDRNVETVPPKESYMRIKSRISTISGLKQPMRMLKRVQSMSLNLRRKNCYKI